MLIILSLCAGFIVGIFITLLVIRARAVGNLVIADDPDDGPYLFMEFTKGTPDTIRTKKHIKLMVVHRKPISQK